MMELGSTGSLYSLWMPCFYLVVGKPEGNEIIQEPLMHMIGRFFLLPDVGHQALSV